MPIKIKCTNPSCGKILNAPDTLAGKKANCPSCKTTLTVPAASAPAPAGAAAPAPAKPAAAKSAPAAASPAPRKPAPPPAPEPKPPPPAEAPPPSADDAEKLAAAMLSDEPKPEDAGPKEFVEFTCQWCDELVKVDASLAGKQTPCPNPECRRITKVPVPADPKKAGWRDAPKKPVGARLDAEPAPEGAWGTATSRGLVSKESLEEAGALPERSEPVGVRTWIARGMVATAVLVLLVGGTLFAFRWFGGKREDALVKKARDAVSGQQLAGAEAGALQLKVGEYYLRRKEPGSVNPVNGDAGAKHQFAEARGKISGQASSNAECEALLIDLALAQLGMGDSNANAIEERRRLTWSLTLTEVARTLQAIPKSDKKASDGRHEGVRLVTRWLLEQRQDALVDDLVRQVTDGPQVLAVVGLEWLRKGKKEQAEKLLTQAGALLKAEQKPAPQGAQPPKKEKEKPPPFLVELVALAYALGQEKDKDLKLETVEAGVLETGKAIAAAFNSAEEARDKAKKLLTPALRFEALVAVADALANPDDARQALKEAVDVAGKEPSAHSVSPWVVERLVRLGAAVGLDDQTLLDAVNWLPGRSQLRGWCQLQVFRQQLKREKDKAVDDSLADGVDSGSLSHRLARAELVRHNTVRDKSAAKKVDEWVAALKPYGYIGAAMGLQGD